MPDPFYSHTEKFEAISPAHLQNWLDDGPAPLFTTSVPWVIAEAQSTPEPATLTLLVSGFLTAGGFGLYRRRRTRAAI
jgi:hypothetical protein